MDDDGGAAVSENARTPAEAPVLAKVRGQALASLPQDLYIPPDALEVFLEAFEGPLDLLLYLIRRQNIDIVDISLADITRQYMEYVDLMKDLRLELAAEYLVMAAMLAEIKSRVLLPRPPASDDEEQDPRAELIRRLQEYERFKQAAETLDALPREERDIFPGEVEPPGRKIVKLEPDVSLKELLVALTAVLARAEMFTHHHVQREALSVRERMSETLSRLEADKFTEFSSLFNVEEGRLGVVVTFLAVLELMKESLIELVQAEPFAPIYVRAAGGYDVDGDVEEQVGE